MIVEWSQSGCSYAVQGAGSEGLAGRTCAAEAREAALLEQLDGAAKVGGAAEARPAASTERLYLPAPRDSTFFSDIKKTVDNHSNLFRRFFFFCNDELKRKRKSGKQTMMSADIGAEETLHAPSQCRVPACPFLRKNHYGKKIC